MLEDIMVLIILAVFGLAMGSFIDALVFRIHAAETGLADTPQARAKKKATKKDLSMLTGRSMCESCHATLQPKDLIPVVSWLSTRGKCRYCGVSVGWQTPVTEILMMLIFMGVYLLLPTDGMTDTQAAFSTTMWLIFSVGLVAMAVYDLRYMILPNKIMLPMIVLAILMVVVEAVIFDGGAGRIRDAVLGLLVGGGLFYALFLFSSGRWIGGGDVKLGFFMGLALGPVAAGVALWLSFNAALVVIGPLLLLGIITRKQHIPFGPFLIAATLFAAVYGLQLAHWYNDSFLYGSF